jgi:glyoxylase-like metal-dependent hydrolase (beta-lactamase superfamily II)/rhodanese-related sulfurtransferase
MQIKQWEDKNLAQFSYAILSDCEKKIVLVDPARDPRPYLNYATEKNATIVGIIETHPHADFISGHLELQQVTGAVIYAHSLVGANYPHTTFDEGDAIEMGQVKLTALHTPGHSPDSITIVLEHEGKQKAVFTGDTLFIGDCGRPDLREGAGNLKVTRLDLAKSMYHSLRDKLLPLEDEVILYPGHGAGTLCGKGLSEADSSTMGAEKKTNWSLQEMSEADFVQNLLSDQPFVPAYFPFDVEVNRNGAAPFVQSVAAVPIGKTVKQESDATELEKDYWIVDARPEKQYKEGHLANSVNLMEGTKFDTWLGSIIRPEEPFYLAGETPEQLQALIERAAAIGYEPQIKKAFVLEYATRQEEKLDLQRFKNNVEDYTIVDVRNSSELKEGKPFSKSISLPLAEVRNKVEELPTDKPIVVHCAGGYRSAAASSIIKSSLDGKVKVFDLGEAIKDFL